jgi:pilus assembly protein FimV
MSKLKVLLALASAALPLTANALGLGEIKLNSALNDRFNADIPVIGATSDELDSLDVKLANMAQFSHAGLERPDVLNQLQFVVVRNADGSSYIHITSNAAVREPFLDFLLDADWNNGELIREYTVLLNPPAFQTTNTAPAPAAAAPAAAPAAVSAVPVAAAPVPVPTPSAATQAAAPETAAPVAQPPAEVAAAPQPQPAPSEVSTPAPTASPPAAPAPSVEQAPAQRALGTNYGPIHRGETLSSIAKSVRPEGVTLNQMMIAIYQANPEVFMHNINRMKSGYILRMPTASDAQGVSVTDANNEVRAQMQAWRSGGIAAAPETAPSASTASSAPALQLVAPGSAAESNGQVPGAATSGSGEAAAVPALPAAPVTKPGKSGKAGKGAAAPVQPEPANQAPLSVESNTGANVQQQAAQQNAAPALPPPAATNVPLSKTPTTAKPKPAQSVQESGGGIMDMIFGIYGIIALIVIAMLVLAVVVIKKRKAGGSSGATSSTRIKADWMKQESMDSGDSTAASSTTRTRGKFKKSAPAEEPQDRTVLSDAPTELSGGGDSDKTMLMAAPPPAPMQETVVSSGGSQLDVSDPMAEADFHMAYGLYDQAADVLRKALRQNPDSRPVQMKLLEVFFTAGDKSNFVNEAKKLRQTMGAAPDKDWESVAIMGRQVAPEESLFSSTGASVSGAVDIALDGSGTDTVVSDLDALEGAFASAGASPVVEAPAPAPAPAEDNSLEFSLPDLEPAAASMDEPMLEAPAPASPGTDFDLGDLNFEPTPSVKPAETKKAEPTLGTDEPTVATDFGTDSQVEFDKALNDLASFVNTNVPAQPETPAEENDDKTLAIRPPKPAAAAEDDLGTIDAAPAGDGGGSSMNEIGTKLDLARAYIDMGDPDGAKSILEEVIAEGNAQQKAEAQELIKHVS